MVVILYLTESAREARVLQVDRRSIQFLQMFLPILSIRFDYANKLTERWTNFLNLDFENETDHVRLIRNLVVELAFTGLTLELRVGNRNWLSRSLVLLLRAR